MTLTETFIVFVFYNDFLECHNSSENCEYEFPTTELLKEILIYSPSIDSVILVEPSPSYFLIIDKIV